MAEALPNQPPEIIPDDEPDQRSLIAATEIGGTALGGVAVDEELDEEQSEEDRLTTGAPMSTDSVRVYLREAGRVPLLNAEQEVELAKAIEAGVLAQEKLDIDDMRRQAKQPSLHQQPSTSLENIENEAEVEPEDAELLSEAMRRDLAELSKNGYATKRHLLEANLRLVISIAKKYTGRGVLFLDLIQEGNLGLVRAVEKFDYEKGYKFSTYATWWIRQAVSRALADQARTIRVPVHRAELINKLNRIERLRTVEYGRDVTHEELAKEMGLSIQEVIALQKDGRDPVSLNSAVGDDGSSEFGDHIEDTDSLSPDEVVGRDLLRREISTVLLSLLQTDRKGLSITQRDKDIFERLYGLKDGHKHTLEEVGREFGLTRERIRQIESKTLAKLRHPSVSEGLREFL